MVACTQSEPARVNDISGTNGSSASPTTSSVYTRPPTNISTGGSAVSSGSSVASHSAQVQPVQATSTSTYANNANVSNSSGNNVVTTQEKIVYNRNYEAIPKGGYQGDSYTVKRGDTLFYIAWVTGNDFRALAAKNGVKEPYSLNVGQVLNVGGGQTVVVTQKTTTPIDAQRSTVSTTTTATTTTRPSQPTQTNTVLSNVKPMSSSSSAETTASTTTVPTTTTTTSTSVAPTVPPASTASNANIVWQWPAQGKVIEGFSSATKGIDISGSLGDKVVAAAAGKIVYAGNALPGYGNLIIVKHNDDYLTAYAHNQSILVKEQQNVRAGEQIATMGSTGTSSVRLHFEIRYKAQSVNPVSYLPK